MVESSDDIYCAESFYIVLERIVNEVEAPEFGGWSTNWAIEELI